MSADEVTTWTGASGTEYQYFIFDRDLSVPARAGLYIYAKKNADDTWAALYMGHGDLDARCQDGTILDAIRAKGATHVHLRLLKRGEDRAEELRDLLGHNAQAFEPHGCQPEADRPPAAPAQAVPAGETTAAPPAA